MRLNYAHSLLSKQIKAPSIRHQRKYLTSNTGYLMIHEKNWTIKPPESSFFRIYTVQTLATLLEHKPTWAWPPSFSPPQDLVGVASCGRSPLCFVVYVVV